MNTQMLKIISKEIRKFRSNLILKKKINVKHILFIKYKKKGKVMNNIQIIKIQSLKFKYKIPIISINKIIFD